MGVKGLWGFIAESYKLQIATILEYRASFLSQTIGMFLNDFFWIFFWYILFNRFESINGWDFHDALLMYMVITGSWALANLSFSNVNALASMIENGQLDYYLTLPKPVLLHVLIKTSYSSAGDLLFSIVLAAWILELSSIPLYLSVLISGALIFLSWGILVNSITFWVGRFESAAKAARDTLIIFAGYPFSVYSGMTRFVLMFLIPVGMIIGIPVDLFQNFSWEWFLLLWVYTAAFFLLCVSFFYLGLRRYSSGNTMGMRG